MNTKYDSESALDVETFPKAFDWYLRAVRQPRAQIARILHCSVDTLNKWRTGEQTEVKKVASRVDLRAWIR